MKRSTISPQETSLRRHPTECSGGAPHQHSPNNALPSITLADIDKKLVEVLAEIAKRHAERRALRLPKVTEMTGDSRSQIYARLNPKCAAHDPSFPRPFYVGKSPRWWQHEVETWLEAQATTTNVRH